MTEEKPKIRTENKIVREGISGPFLDVKAEVAKLQQMYREEPQSGSFNFLLLGEMGTGKTFLLHSARKPIHLDCFDPGGTKNLSLSADYGRRTVPKIPRHIEDDIIQIKSNRPFLRFV